MATSPFTEGVTKVIEENTIWKSIKDVTKFGEILFQRKIFQFLLIEFSKPVKFQWKLASFLNTSNQKKIVTEWFQQQKSFQQNSKAPKQLY